MRSLKVLVIAMGIAILIATTVLVTVIIQRGARLASDDVADGSGGAEVAAPAPAATLALPPGAAVRETRLEGDRLVLRARLENNTEAVFVFDAGTGALVRRYDISTAVAP